MNGTSDGAGGQFGPFAPGFNFLQNFLKQAAAQQSSALGAAAVPGFNHWVAPTLNVEDLEKRIQEMKAVQFWLDQNAKALAATIQALEVQKMTLATLKSMNFNMDDLAQALKLKTAETLSACAAAATASATSFAGVGSAEQTGGAAPTSTSTDAAGAHTGVGAIPGGAAPDPSQWWLALSAQFERIATGAMKDMAAQSRAQPPAGPAAGSEPPAAA